jgi:hypothetical protein
LEIEKIIFGNNEQCSFIYKLDNYTYSDASKLTLEKGMFWYAEGPENGNGYTFWMMLKYEKLGTVAQPRPAIF